MTPDSKISEEAVKAAFAYADLKASKTATYGELWNAQRILEPFTLDDETAYNASLRILAAHARAQQERAQNAERLCIAAKDCMLANDSDSIVASCNCLVMTPEIKHHKKGCKYRLITERNAWRGMAERLAYMIKNHFGPAPGNATVAAQKTRDLLKEIKTLQSQENETRP